MTPTPSGTRSSVAVPAIASRIFGRILASVLVVQIWLISPGHASAQPTYNSDWIAQLPASSIEGEMDPQRLLARLLSARASSQAAGTVQTGTVKPSANDKAQMHLALGHRLRQAGELEAAVSHYGLAARLDPELAEAHLVLGSLLGLQGRFRQAARAFAWLIELDPGDIRGYRGRALALQRSGMPRLAKDTLEEGLRRAGDTPPPELLHLLARLLATSSDATVRDGARAVELAQRALAASAQAPYAETMAMALAEAGRFPDAVAVQRNLLQQAQRSSADAAWIAQLEQRLALFEAGQAWHEP